MNLASLAVLLFGGVPHHHINWWMVALIVSAVSTQIRDYVPKPGCAPGFISNPWYPLIYHGLLDVLSLSFLRGLQGLANGKVPDAQANTDPPVPKS